MSRFNISTRGANKTVNLAGGKAFKLGTEAELVHAVLTTFLDDKFYETGGDRLVRLQGLIASVASKSPEFVAKLALVARREFHLRSVSHVLLGELSREHSGDDLVKRAIVAFAERPDDLSEVAAYVGLPFPKQVKRGIRNAILKFGRYALAKYRGDNKGFSLVDLFNLTHPKVKHANKEQKEAWKDLMEGNLKSEDTWESKVSAAKDNEGRAEAWEDLILNSKIGYMALIRNLNNLVKHGVSETVVAKAADILTDRERVLKSKLIPFRFLTAYNNTVGSRVLKNAVSEAMDIAVSNAPELPGRTLIAIDKSGSMDGDPLEKAAIFGATLMKANKNADVMLFANQSAMFEEAARIPVIDLSQKIINHPLHGGTDTSLVFDTDKVYDRIIILSDNESWMSDCQTAFTAYKKRTGADPFVYAVDIQGYGTKDISGEKVFHVAGFSDKVLDFIGAIERGESLVEYVRNYELA